MNWEIFQTTNEQLLEQLNAAKEVVILGLETEGLLNGKAEEIAGKYAVVVIGKNWLGRTVDKILGRAANDPDSRILRFVKIV